MTTQLEGAIKSLRLVEAPNRNNHNDDYLASEFCLSFNKLSVKDVFGTGDSLDLAQSSLRTEFQNVREDCLKERSKQKGNTGEKRGDDGER